MSLRALEETGVQPTQNVYRNLAVADLVEHALRNGEGVLSETGALVVNTALRTGRSAKDKFIVDSSEVHDEIAWGAVNVAISQEVFDALYSRVAAHLSDGDIYVFDGYAGVPPDYAKRFRIVGELASQALFANQLLRRPSDKMLVGFQPDYTFLVAPSFKCDPKRDGTRSDAAVMIDYINRKVVIAGTRYSGEIKKTVFSIMNYVLPSQGVLPMHCSANMAQDGSTAVFFGLSGTGKTTLSTDRMRRLIGDDEHGWADDMVFNFEGGCYAKCIDLSEQHEPDIYNAIRFGALVENVVVNPKTRQLDFADSSITENTRVGYPVSYISNIQADGKGRVPSTVIFLTADAFGVLPPIAKLNLNQAMYYFLSGYTSKVAGTEVGVSEPVPTFSTCFGEPFLPLDPLRYALMLKEKVRNARADVYLVNSGWNGRGERMPLKYTRAMVNAALDGQLDNVDYVRDAHFGFMVPSSCPGCPSYMLDPVQSWASRAEYDLQAVKLAGMFRDNFAKKYSHVPKEIQQAGPA
ncbi:phosphoenolpyruvate carboxykinase (ATP) [Adlercreutzia sp. ZJ304]|uniref:phosphoenolpyruvate carboxykinase (ATP) n=1 Tax=Adlercreutzia sp. ZJ304 TaxID=2709791 RepID=UPI0013EE3AE3|nr:phosphoenolpyruvate carboxykinase (ATP) [Adlercreutzia sp. ZJ304]